MSAIASLVFIAMISSIMLAALAWFIADRFEALRGAGSVPVWRMARLAALIPFFVAAAAPFVPAPALPELTRVRTVSSPAAADIREVPARPSIDAATHAVEAAYEAEPAAGGFTSYISLLEEARADWIEVLAQAASALVLALYLMGLAAALTGFLINRVIMARLIARSAPAEGALEALKANWANRLALDPARVRLRFSEAASTPFLTGLIPTIVFPRTLAEAGQGRVGEYALVHELVHLKRGDERDRFVGELLGVFLWFNPAFARIERRLSLAREMACDAKTLAVLGRRANARAYARALIEVPWVERPGADVISAFGLSVGKVRKMRIKAILEQTGERKGQALFATAAAAALSLAIVPVAAAQVLVSASLAGEPAASVTLLAASQAEAGTPIRRAIDASPFMALEELERLEALEALEDIDARQVLMNPANWASIVGVASGASEVISLTLEDANGNPVNIRAKAQGDGDARVEFTDETGERLVIDVVEHNAGGREEVTIGVLDAEHPLIHVIDGGGETDVRFLDQRDRPVYLGVRERGEASAVLIEDTMSGERSEFVFVDSDPDVFAPAAGRVSATGTDAEGPDSAGHYVVVDHGTGWSTIYYNLAEIAVSRGDRLGQGELIGRGHGEGDGVDFDSLRRGTTFNNTDMTIVRTADIDL